MLNQLVNNFLYCLAVGAIWRINPSNVDLQEVQCWSCNRECLYCDWSRDIQWNIAWALRLYFIIYPHSRHDTYSIKEIAIFTYTKLHIFDFFLHFLDFAFDSHFRILKLQSQQKIYFVEPWSLVQAIMVTHNSVYTHLAFSWKKNCPKSSVNKVVRCNYILHGIFSMFYPESKLTSNQ